MNDGRNIRELDGKTERNTESRRSRTSQCASDTVHGKMSRGRRDRLLMHRTSHEIRDRIVFPSLNVPDSSTRYVSLYISGYAGTVPHVTERRSTKPSVRSNVYSNGNLNRHNLLHKENTLMGCTRAHVTIYSRL